MNIPKKLSLSILAFATVLGAAHGSTLMRRIEAMEGQIDILRKLISDVYCAQHSGAFAAILFVKVDNAIIEAFSSP